MKNNILEDKRMVSDDRYADMIKLFHTSDVLQDDTLTKALDRLYVVNKDQVDDQAEAAEMRQEEIDEYKAELAEKVEAGEMDEAAAEKALRQFKPQTRIPFKQPVNLLVMGDPGGGKTSIIEQWGDNRDVKIVKKTAADITASVARGLPAVDEVVNPEDPTKEKVKIQAYLPSTFFDALDDPDYEYTVLFVDEINRSYADAESAILTLVCDHSVNNRNYKSGRKVYSQYLFTIAACNPPANSPEARKLSLAMNTRFQLYIWNNNPEELRNFINDELDLRIKIQDHKLKKDPNNEKAIRQKDWNEKRKEIINALVDGGLQFSDTQENNEVGDPDNVEDPEDIHVVNARTLMTALLSCNGEVGLDPTGGYDYPQGSFMYQFRNNCTTRREKLDSVAMMLQDLNDDMESRANGFQKSIYDMYSRWMKVNGAKYGL